MTSSAGAPWCRRQLAPDHVRDRRRARPLRARAAAPARLARLAARARSATAPGRRRSSTSTASCSTRSSSTASSSASCTRRSSASSPTSRTPPPRGWQRARRRHVGDARRAAAPPVLEGALLDGARPRREARAAARRARAEADEWAAERDRVRAAVLERGWSEARSAYAQAFDSDELDAAALLMPLVGLPAARTIRGCARRSRRSPATSPRTASCCATATRRA